MLTQKQIAWLETFKSERIIKVVPYNPKSREIFEQIRKNILDFLQTEVEVILRGASAMEIAGKGDIDAYVSVPASEFDHYLSRIKGLYGEPNSLYPLERARWSMEIEGFETEVMLVNNEHDAWKRASAIEDYLYSNKEAMDRYRQIKENTNGATIKEYYRAKLEFINEVLEILGIPIQ